jgi:hypothetical protein
MRREKRIIDAEERSSSEAFWATMEEPYMIIAMIA